MVDSAQQTDIRITSNGNIVKSNQKLFNFYEYRDKTRKDVETSTTYFKPTINKNVQSSNFTNEDSSDSDYNQKFNKVRL